MAIEPFNLDTACLGRSFYDRNTTEVAKSLLGKILIRKLALPGQIMSLAGYIIETEAYGSRDDPASHAFNGLKQRNCAMFGEVGRLYVYFVYGRHICVNVTARKIHTEAGAVLIRSILPLAGHDMMSKMRKHSKILTTGPGRVTEAMSITLAHNGLDVTQRTSLISIHQGQEVANILTSTRIGISKANDKPWRYIATELASDVAIKPLPK